MKPLASALLALLALAAPASAQELVIAAASSLTDAFEEIGTAFERTQPNARVTLHLAGSSTLLTQIRQGAPFDVFASANEALIAAANAEGLLLHDPIAFARNSVVVITPPGGRVASLADLAAPGIRLVLASENVPAGAYARTIITALAATYGEAYPKAVLANLASEEANVRQTALRVAWGEADAAFVYATDAAALRVATLPIDPALAAIATYPAAALRGTRENALARSFVAFLTSPEARAILLRHGFTLP